MSDQRVSFFARGGGWVLAQSVLLLGVIVPSVWFHEKHLPLPAIAMGTALFASGACFGIAGARAIGRALTPFPKPRSGAPLVQTGIYAQVRHPLYTSVILMSLGTALVSLNVIALAAALALLPFFHAKARQEEGWLRRQYPDYDDYARRVPRFLPRWGKPEILFCNF